MFRSSANLNGALALVAAPVAVLVGALIFLPISSDVEEPSQALEDIPVEIRPVQGSIYMLVGAGGNITVQIGNDGVLLVDTQYASIGDKNLAAIRELTAGPIIYAVNTHFHGDHVSGNDYFYENSGGRNEHSGATDSTGADVKMKIIAHRNVRSRIAELGEDRMRQSLLPTDTYEGALAFRFNGEDVRLTHQPAAHTDGDTFVYFSESNVLSAGDIFNNEIYPFVDRWKGGTFQGLVSALDNLLLIARSGDGRSETRVIPGHGPVATEADIAEYRKMLVTIRDRVQDMVDRGMSLKEILAARPTREYDERFGTTSGAWTTNQFVESIYVDLPRRE